MRISGADMFVNNLAIYGGGQNVKTYYHNLNQKLIGSLTKLTHFQQLDKTVLISIKTAPGNFHPPIDFLEVQSTTNKLCPPLPASARDYIPSLHSFHNKRSATSGLPLSSQRSVLGGWSISSMLKGV
jgi:hypothetical protein